MAYYRTTAQKALAKLFREDSIFAVLLSGGNEENWGFSLLAQPGLVRDVGSIAFRRVYSAIMDCGVACTDRNPAPVRTLLGRSAASAALLFAARMAVGARARL